MAVRAKVEERKEKKNQCDDLFMNDKKIYEE